MRRLLLALGILLLLPLLALAGLLVFAGSEGGTRYLLAKGMDAAAAAGLTVKAEVSGSLLDRLDLREVVLSDPQGVWLRADRLALAWAPSALLAGRLRLEALEAGTVHVLRPPALPPSPNPEPGPPQASGPPPLHLLGRVTLRRLALDSVILDAPVLGQDLALTAEATATGREDRGVDVSARLQRLDQPGELTLTAGLGFDHSLTLALKAGEPAGGAVAGLLGLPGAPAVRLRLDGAGPAAAWAGRLTAEAEGLAAADLGLTVAAALERNALRLGVDGRLSLGDAAPAIARDALPHGLALTLDAAAAEDGSLSVDRLDATADAWTLKATARRAPDGRLDAAADASLRDGAWLAPHAGLPVGAADLRLTAAGPPDALAVTLALSLRDTLVRSLGLEATATLGQADGTVPFTASGLVEGLAPLAPDLSGLPGGDTLSWRLSGALEAGGQRLRLDTLNARGAGVEADGGLAVVLGPAAPTASGLITARAADLGVFAPLAGGLALGGSATLTAALTEGGESGGKGRVDLTASGLRTGIAQVDGLLGPEVTAAADLLLSGQDARIPALSLRAAGLRVDGALALPGLQTLDGRVTIEAPNLALIDPATLAGAARIEAQLAGPLAAAEVKATLSTQGLKAGGVPIDHLSARLEASARKVGLADLRLEAAGLRLTGKAEAPLPEAKASGRFDLRLTDPAKLATVAGASVGGTLDGRLDLSAANGKQGAALSLTGSALSLDGKPLADRLTVTARSPDLPAAPLALSVAVEGRSPWPYGLKAEATAQATPGGGTLRLSTLSARAAAHRLELTAPATLAQDDAAQAVEMALRLDGAPLALNWRHDGARTQATLTTQGLPLALADLVQPTGLPTGTVDLSLTLSGSDAAPNGSFSLRTHRLAVPEADLKGLGLRLDGRIDAGRLTADASLDGLGKTPVQLHAETRLALAGGLPAPSPAAPLRANVRWSGDVGPLMELAPADGHQLRGPLSLAVDVGGTLGAPQASGAVTLKDGSYENLEWGTLLTALNVEARFRDDGSLSVQAMAADGGKGRLEARASVTPPADGAGDPRIDAAATLSNLTVVRRDDLKAAIGGTLDFAGTPSDGRLAAALRTEGVELFLGGAMGGGPATLTVVEPGAAPPPPKAGGGIALDVQVALPKRVFVRAESFESEWEGEIAVTGTAAAPVVHGEVRPVRGAAEVLGKTFTLEPGSVSLHGDLPPNPQLDLKLSHQAEDIKATVRVAGSARKPAISLQSTPSLPQDEIIARVLFGKGLKQLGPGQALAVAQQAARMSGALGSGPGFTDRIRGATGLDVLNVGGGDSGPGVEAGKYIADGVYVGVEQGLSPGSSAVKVEVELTPSLSLETKSSPTTGSTLGVMWSTDY